MDHIFSEYVGAHTTNSDLAEQYLSALQRITRRLGGARSTELQKMVSDAFATGSIETHRGWIKGLLDAYYDPMYDYQLAKKTERIEFCGDAAAVIEYVHDWTARQPR